MPVPQPLPPIATEPLSVVLLAREAGADLETLLDAWTAFLDRRGQQYELLLVDDGSADGTADRAAALMSRMPRLRVLCQPTPQGEGAAFRRGLAEAKHPLLFTTLCHPDYKPEHLGLLLDRPLASPATGKEIDQVHLLAGYRAGVRLPWGWRLLSGTSRVLNWLAFGYDPKPLPGWLGWRGYAGWLAMRILFGLRYHDVGSPVHLLRREILPRIPIQSDSSFAHVELLAKANFLGHLMGEEVPLEIAPRRYRGDLGLLWRDCKRLFVHPDFGPAVLPVPVAPEPPVPTPPAGAEPA